MEKIQPRKIEKNSEKVKEVPNKIRGALGTLRKVAEIKTVTERKSKESEKIVPEKKTDNKVENVAKVFGETVKLVKEREVKKVTEKERELRKKALKEKIEGYEQKNRERAAESTDRKVDRKKKSRDQSIKFATETVKEERKYEGKSIRKK